MAKVLCIALPPGISGKAPAMIRWCCGRERRFVGPKKRRCQGGTVRLGSRRRRRVMLRRLVHWSRAQWRLVVEILRPLKKVVIEVAAGRRFMESPHLSLPFVYPFQFPLL
ncbi:hypothetical protein IHE45_10G034900 [Dioscorea alata]|uniref:Uncharacterized protein n=1 Tax=Dioscorea alata TaxID=55571 RepID=A0ACB7VAD5_DIOAL|nr:hypothetical protein IHE45_10G034900 [Dioscorea alata]